MRVRVCKRVCVCACVHACGYVHPLFLHWHCNASSISLSVPSFWSGGVAMAGGTKARLKQVDAGVQPLVHLQVNEPMPSVQVPPFPHGLGEQSLMLTSHSCPVHPGRHVHTKPPFVF